MDEKTLRSACDRALEYLDGLDARSTGPVPGAAEKLAEMLAGSLPEAPTPAETVLEQLDTFGSPATVASAGGRYFGFVTGGALPAALAANWLAGAWDQNGFGFVSSPAATIIEEVALGWLLDVLDLPPGSAGAFVTGATMANFTALAAARSHVLGEAGWDVAARGLFGAPEITVIVGEHAHSTLFKALGLVGLGRERVVRVPADDQGRMRSDALPDFSTTAIVCLQAGEVNTGAFDPATQICARAQEAGAWVHVDGAFGLWASAAPGRRHLMAGFGEADSWATDAHKWLNVPYDSGIVFVRRPDALRQAMSISADYLPSSAHRDAMEFTPETSRRARGIEVWAALRMLGRQGVAELVERNCRAATAFSEGLGAAGFDILNDVVLNQVLVAFGDDETTQRVIAGVQEDGTCWCGGTKWRGRAAMRISVSSWATTHEDVGRSLAAIIRIAKNNR